MSTDRDVNFLYRGALGKEHVLLLVNLFCQKGLEVVTSSHDPRPIEEALEEVETKKPACIRFELPLHEENKKIGIYLSFYQPEKSQIFTIGIMTNNSYFRYKEVVLLFSNLCEDIYYLTKPLVGTGYVLEYSDVDNLAKKKFFQTGDLKDLVVQDKYKPRKGLIGCDPNFYSPEALKELQGTGIKFGPEVKKLKDGGLLDGTFP